MNKVQFEIAGACFRDFDCGRSLQTVCTQRSEQSSFSQKCDHQHCDICDRCEHVMSVLDDIEIALQSQKNLSVDDSEELRFIVC